MNKEAHKSIQILSQQLELCEKQDQILKEIDLKLHNMKEIAQYVIVFELTALEKEQLI